ncbi:MAG: 2,3-bisphosphoglycerate-independent phosphoglycerate mutase [Acidobacteriaceae bacterium]|nr:2,3-bisphosphoglycerate-independent phosphoglycerate mutase [Acidobacteriaceae bacterium]
MRKNGPVLLTILDGWGYRAETKANAIALARKPTYDKLLAEYPHTLVRASEHFVGLPDGQMGNSEVGHLNLGAGRVVRMDITRIDTAIDSGEFFKDPTLVHLMEHAAQQNRALHLIGLVSDGGVHSHQRHLYALLKMAAMFHLKRVYVHAFMDGRDTLPTSGVGYLEELQQKFAEYGVGQIASVSGRYFAMDRDLRWEKELKAFRAMCTTSAEGGAYADPVARVRESYNNGITDEFVEPFLCLDEKGDPIGRIEDEDAVLCFNYRADRVRQITRVLARRSGLTKTAGIELPKAAELDEEIPIEGVPQNLLYITMTQYDPKFKLPMVIPPESMDNLLANVMERFELRNLRVAETEKYAHVTYFFNGGIEKPFKGEDRELVQSKKVATYDLAPEMSSEGIGDIVVRSLNDTAFDIVIVNFANADMVGHSGKIEPTVKAVEAVDAQLARIYQAVKQANARWIITADHGNAEMLIDPVSGGPHTAHTTNPVPFIYVGEDAAKYSLRSDGSLRDISPTILGALDIELPKEMTGGDMRLKIDA